MVVVYFLIIIKKQKKKRERRGEGEIERNRVKKRINNLMKEFKMNDEH